MARKASESNKKLRPAMSREARMQQLSNLALENAEEQLRNGTASSQVITTFIKYDIERQKAELELEKLREENKLLKAKTEAIQNQQTAEELYANAIKAMSIYQGKYVPEDEGEEQDESNY